MRETTPDSVAANRREVLLTLLIFAILMIAMVGMQVAKRFEIEQHSRPARSSEVR
jgi:Tfp pilus assembly protein PilV